MINRIIKYNASVIGKEVLSFLVFDVIPILNIFFYILVVKIAIYGLELFFSKVLSTLRNPEKALDIYAVLATGGIGTVSQPE